MEIVKRFLSRISNNSIITLFAIGWMHAQCIGQIPKDLFISEDYSFRNPVINVSVNGTVIAICVVTKNQRNNLPNKSHLAIARSFDSGKTWDPLNNILDRREGFEYSSPSLIIDRITGKIFCFYTQLQSLTSMPDTNKQDETGALHAKYIYSEDDGDSWSDPVDINSMIKAKEGGGLYTSSGHGIQTRTGRLIQPYVIKSSKKSNGNFQTHVRNFYSDDHGETWNMSKPIGFQAREATVVELADGRISQNMRNIQTQYRSISISEDDGKSFFEMSQDRTLKNSKCNMSITRLGTEWEGDDYNVLAFCNTSSEECKKKLTVRLSFDEGNSWPIAIPVYEGPSTNSSLIRLYDGGLGIVYESGINGSNKKIGFAKLERKLLNGLVQKEVNINNISKRFQHSPDYYHSTHLFSLLPDTKDEIIFLGNSITDGGEWSELFDNSRMKNRGKSGDVTDGILYCLHTITKLKPLKIFLLIGTNDLSQGKSVNYLIMNHLKIYDRIKKESPETQLYVQSILPVNDYFGKYEYHMNNTDLIIDANQRLKQIAKERGHIYVDLFTPMSDVNNKLRRDLTEDGVHLNGRGYQIWKYVLIKNKLVD